MADVAKGSVLLTPRFDGLEASLSKQLSGAMSKVDGSGYGSKVGSGFSSGFSAKVGAVAGIASSVASSAFNAVAGSLGSAISRVDQLNNFPKVMQNLGYSAEDAQESINRMGEAIDGMPTSLDSISGMVQQLAPLTGGLDEATDLGIAFNNMLLAGGANTVDVTRAMQQYTQALGKGKFELEDWRTLQEVMPGQLNQVAQALLGAEAGSQDLYEAMKEGSVSIDEFNDAIVELSSEGANGFASFEQQAKDSTQGIGTALTNVQNRISKAVGKIIEAIGAENISGAINAFSSSFDGIATSIAGAIEAVKPVVSSSFDKIAASVAGAIEAVKPVVSSVAGFVSGNIGAIVPVIGGLVGSMGGLKAASAVAPAVSKLGEAFSALKNAGSAASAIKLVGGALSKAMGGPVGIAITLIGLLAGAFATLWTTNEGFRNAITTAWSAIQQAAAVVWPYIQNAITVVMGVVQTVVQTAWPVIQQVFQIAGAIIMSIVQTAWPVIQSLITNVMGVVQTIVTTAWPVIQNAFMLAGMIIQGIIQQVWPIVQVLIGNAMIGVRTIVTTVWPIVQAAFQTACGIIQGVINTVFPIIQGVISTVMGAINTVISVVMSIIQGDWEGAWETISQALSDAWEGIQQAVSDGIDAVVQFFTDLPGNILGALGDLGNLLFEAGSSIINGLMDGIENTINGVYEFVSGIGSTIASLKGPIPYDLKLLVPNGEAIMEGLREGIGGGLGEVLADVRGIAPALEAEMGAASLAFSARAAAPSDGGAGDDLAQAVEQLHRDLSKIYKVIPEGMTRRQFGRAVRGAL